MIISLLIIDDHEGAALAADENLVIMHLIKIAVFGVPTAGRELCLLMIFDSF